MKGRVKGIERWREGGRNGEILHFANFVFIIKRYMFRF